MCFCDFHLLFIIYGISLYSDLARNYLSGTIPQQWGSFTRLLNMYSLSLSLCVCVFFVTFILLFMASPVLQFSSWKPVDRFHSHRAWKYLNSQKFVSSYSYCALPPFHSIELVERV